MTKMYHRHDSLLIFQGSRGPQGTMGPPGKSGRRVSEKNVFVEKKCSFGQECSVENKTWVFGKWDVCDPQIESLLKHIPPLLVSPQGRAGADGARGMPGESGTKVVTSLWGHSSFQHELCWLLFLSFLELSSSHG